MTNNYSRYYFDLDLEKHTETAEPMVSESNLGTEQMTIDAKADTAANNSNVTKTDQDIEQEQLAAERSAAISLAEHEQQLKLACEAARQEGLALGKEQGHEQGYQQGITEGKQNAHKEYHDQNEEAGLQLLEKIEKELIKLALVQNEWFDNYTADVADLVTAIMRKIMPVYLERHGNKEIQAFIQQVLGMIVDKPGLEIQLSRQSDEMAAEIKQLMNKAGAGLSVNVGNEPVAIKLNPDLNPSECVVRWQGGRVQRQMEGFWNDIDNAIKRMRASVTVG